MEAVAFVGGVRRAGTTSVLALLARALAGMGLRVVVLDAHIGHGGIDRALRIPPSPDLGDVLAGRCTLARALHPTGDVRALGVGRVAPSAADDGLESRLRLVTQLEELSHDVDLLLFDVGTATTPEAAFFARAANRLVVVTTREPRTFAKTAGVLRAALGERPKALVHVVVNRTRTPAESRHAFGEIVRLLGPVLSAEIQYCGEIPERRGARGDARVTAEIQSAATGVAAQLARTAARERRAALPCLFR